MAQMDSSKKPVDIHFNKLNVLSVRQKGILANS